MVCYDLLSDRCAYFHAEFDAFLKHENIKTKILLNFRANFQIRPYFHQKPLFYCIISTKFIFALQTLQSKYFPIELSPINSSIGAWIVDDLMFGVFPTDAEDFYVNWKYAPSCVENEDFSVGAFFDDWKREFWYVGFGIV